MNKKLFLTTLLALMTLVSFAQEKPGWIYKKPKPSNNTYLYVVEAATGSTEREARTQAFARLFLNTAMRLGQPVNSDEINQAVQNGESFEVISSQFNIPINKVCEYGERNKDGFRIYLLCQVAKAGNIIVDFDYDFDGCQDIKQYRNGPAFIKSMFLPGLGQMGKRRYGEGMFTLLTELALLGGAYYTYNEAQKQLDIMKDANTTYKGFMSAKETYGTLRIVNYACLGGAAAIYVFNLYRAVATKPRYKKRSYAFNPTVMPNNGYDVACGIRLTLKF